MSELSGQNKHRYKRKKRNAFQQFFNNIKKKLGLKSSHNRQKPEEKPTSRKSKDNSESIIDKIAIQSSKRIVPKKRKSKKPSLSLSEYFHEYFKTSERATAQKRKKQLKKKFKKKRELKYSKENRVNYIRTFFPNYKKQKIETPSPIQEDIKSRKQKVIDHRKQQEKNYYKYTVNSLALYVIAYLLVYLTYQIVVMIVASRWHLDSVLFYYDLAFNDFSPLWTRFNIIVVTFSGPLISLLIGILFLKVIANRPKVKGFIKLFVIWIALHGFNLFFGAFASGVSTDQGFGYVANWLYLNVFWQIFLSLVFLFILGAIGYYSTGKFLETSNSIYRIKKENRNRFILYQVILPWLIGGLLIYLIKVPNNLPYDIGNLITMSIVVIPVVFNKKAKPGRKYKSDKKATRINWVYIIIFLFMVTSFRIWLETGLHIELTYEISLKITPV